VPLPDAVTVMRNWVATRPSLQALLDAGDGTYNVATRLPNDAGSKMPFVVVRRIGGQPHQNAPVDWPLIQFEVFGAVQTVKGFKPDDEMASAVARQLVEELQLIGFGVEIDDGDEVAWVYDAQVVLGPLDFENEGSRFARQMVMSRTAMREVA